MLNFENYRLIKEQNESLNETINGQHTNEYIESIDEALGTIAAVAGGATALAGLAGLLIAKKKLKKLGKEYQDALVQQKLNDIDFQKKVQAHAEKGNKLSAEQKETLKAANKAKNDALRDQASEVAGKMDDLGKSNDVIKKLVTVVKRKAKIAALEVVVKNADNEENKQAAIEQLDGAKKELKDGLRDYESAEKEAEKDSDWDNVKDKDKGEGDKDKGEGDKGNGDKEPNKNPKPEDNTDTETKEKQIKNLEENVEKAKTAYEAQKELAAEEGADDEKKKKAIELEIKYLKAKKALAEVKEESTDDLDKEIANKEEELSTYGMSPEQKEKIKNIKTELKELNDKYTQAKEGLGDGKDEKNSKKCLEAKKAKLEKEKEMAEVKEDKETIDKLTEEISKLEKELQRTDLED